jgi:hypothetical protein
MRALSLTHDGTLHQELRYAMASIGEKISDADLEEMVREMDVNRDGEISYAEFVKWVDGDRATSWPQEAEKQGPVNRDKLNAELESVGLPKLLELSTAQVSRWYKICSRKGKGALIKAKRKFRDKCRGFVEFGFSSATPDKHVALDYSSALACKGKCCEGWKSGEFCSKHRATVLEINTGQVCACITNLFSGAEQDFV